MQMSREVPYIGHLSRGLDDSWCSFSNIHCLVDDIVVIGEWLRSDMETVGNLARISQAFPSRAGQESVNYESAQLLPGDGVLKHIEVDKNEQTRSLPTLVPRSRNKLDNCGLALGNARAVDLAREDSCHY